VSSKILEDYFACAFPATAGGISVRKIFENLPEYTMSYHTRPQRMSAFSASGSLFCFNFNLIEIRA
jgi:hypothetical protein